MYGFAFQINGHRKGSFKSALEMSQSVSPCLMSSGGHSEWALLVQQFTVEPLRPVSPLPVLFPPGTTDRFLINGSARLLSAA
jgi:hypothetical protein